MLLQTRNLEPSRGSRRPCLQGAFVTAERPREATSRLSRPLSLPRAPFLALSLYLLVLKTYKLIRFNLKVLINNPLQQFRFLSHPPGISFTLRASTSCDPYTQDIEWPWHFCLEKEKHDNNKAKHENKIAKYKTGKTGIHCQSAKATCNIPSTPAKHFCFS